MVVAWACGGSMGMCMSGGHVHTALVSSGSMSMWWQDGYVVAAWLCDGSMAMCLHVVAS